MFRRRMMEKQQNIIQPTYIEGVGGAYIDLDYIPTENILRRYKLLALTNIYIYIKNIKEWSDILCHS